MREAFSVRRVLSLMRQDLTVALRDNIVTYMVIAPILMALAFRLLIPAAESSNLIFAVEEGLNPDFVAGLRRYGDVESYDRAGVMDRVEQLDAAAGVLNEGGEVCLLFEGNESQPLIEAYRVVFEDVGREASVADYREVSVGPGRSVTYDIIAIALVMATLFITGVVPGFSIVDERDTRSLDALAVSPIRVGEYAASRGAFATVLSLVIVVPVSRIIAGPSADLWQLLSLVILSAPLVTLVGMLTGLFAHNQVTAIAILKISMPVYVMLPLASLLVPEKLRFLFYVFPSYWQFEALKTIYAASLKAHGFWLSSAMTLVTGGLYLVVAAREFRKRVGLR